ncbi:MAG: hypothetical protein LBH13_06605 [Cellulomonadaceae bacterium]|nr:hypothetical protein [Cellulomonadaceae bacterium]
MRDHIDAVAATLSVLGLPIYVTTVPDDAPPLPYIMVWMGPGATTARDQPLDQVHNLTVPVGITAVAPDPQGASQVANDVRLLLGQGNWCDLAVKGHTAAIRWSHFATASTNPGGDVPTTPNNPAIEVHMYQIASSPL